VLGKSIQSRSCGALPFTLMKELDVKIIFMKRKEKLGDVSCLISHRRFTKRVIWKF
jgi:hypothetical protein